MFDALHLLDQHVFVDVETTGLDASRDEIIEVGAVFVRGGVVEREATWLVQPHQPIPALITALTGLDRESLEGALAFEALRPTLAADLRGFTLVAHNARFERAFLGPTLAEAPMLDSCELALLLFPELKSHALDALVRWAGIGEGARHRALADAQDGLRVTQVLLERAVTEAPAQQLELLAARLPPGPLANLLTRLARAASHPGRSTEAKRPARPTLPEALERWVARPGPLALELERGDVGELVRHAAERVAGSTWLVAPEGWLAALDGLAPLPPCETAVSAPGLEALLARPRPEDPATATALAYLERWSRRGGRDVEALSGFFRAQVPSLRLTQTLLERAATTPPGAGVYAGSLAHAAGWLERGVAPSALVWLDAPALPELERRRLTITVHPGALLELPALFELACPGVPLPSGCAQLRDAAQALAASGAGAADPGAVGEALTAVGRALERWQGELTALPAAPLLDGVLRRSTQLLARSRRLRQPDAPGGRRATATVVSLTPSLAGAEASLRALAARAPSLFVSDVRRADGWSERWGCPDVEADGAARATRPVRLEGSLRDDGALAARALAPRGPITVLVAEELTEPLVRALVDHAAAQGRRVRLHPSELSAGDVLLQRWRGLPPCPRVHGVVVLVGAGDRFGLRRLTAVGVTVDSVLLRAAFEPEAWSAALAGLPWVTGAPSPPGLP
ncbi:MAG: 3'-5' exonuclease [Myxococcaceae bacterium]|nr:3'-5' exonuclease [Myxococcaceae bacterium]